MTWDKITPRIRQLGYCCRWAFLQAHKNTPTKELAELLQVTPRTVRYFRTSTNLCLERKDCLKAAAERLNKAR